MWWPPFLIIFIDLHINFGGLGTRVDGHGRFYKALVGLVPRAGSHDWARHYLAQQMFPILLILIIHRYFLTIFKSLFKVKILCVVK